MTVAAGPFGHGHASTASVFLDVDASISLIVLKKAPPLHTASSGARPAYASSGLTASNVSTDFGRGSEMN